MKEREADRQTDKGKRTSGQDLAMTSLIYMRTCNRKTLHKPLKPTIIPMGTRESRDTLGRPHMAG